MCNGLGYIVPIVLFSVLYNLVKFFEIETVYLEHEEWMVDSNGTNISTTVQYPWMNATDLRRNPVRYKSITKCRLNALHCRCMPSMWCSC